MSQAYPNPAKMIAADSLSGHKVFPLSDDLPPGIPPGDYVVQMPGYGEGIMTAGPVKPFTTITYSALGKFTACPRHWYWAEFKRLKRKAEPVTGPLPFGSRIHVALELWGRNKVAAPVDIWGTLMDQEYSYAEENGWDTSELDLESKQGHAMLAGFPDWLEQNGFWARYETVSVEEAMYDEMKIDTAEGPVLIKLQGKADQLVRRRLDGRIFVLDWKTSAQMSDSVMTVMQKSPQFRIYAYLAKKRNPGLLFGGALALILKKVQQTKQANPPFYRELEISISKPDMDEYMIRLRAKAAELVRAIRRLNAGEDWRTVTTFEPSRINCMSCPFRGPCDLQASFPQGSAAMLANEYVEHDPLMRYEKSAHDLDGLI